MGLSRSFAAQLTHRTQPSFAFIPLSRGYSLSLETVIAGHPTAHRETTPQPTSIPKLDHLDPPLPLFSNKQPHTSPSQNPSLPLSFALGQARHRRSPWLLSGDHADTSTPPHTAVGAASHHNHHNPDHSCLLSVFPTNHRSQTETRPNTTTARPPTTPPETNPKQPYTPPYHRPCQLYPPQHTLNHPLSFPLLFPSRSSPKQKLHPTGSLTPPLNHHTATPLPPAYPATATVHNPRPPPFGVV